MQSFKRLIMLAVALLLIAGALFGCDHAAPSPIPSAPDVSAQGAGPGSGANLQYIYCPAGGACVTAYQGGQIALFSDSGTTRTFFVDGATGNVTATNATVTDITASGNLTLTNVTVTSALTLNGSAFSGAMRGGTVTTQTNGAEVTHGFSVTPTACLVSMKYTGTDIISASVKAISATVFSANVSTTGTMYWMCGK